MEEIAAFVKGAICDDQCLGRCLYIHGVPGTGKVKTSPSPFSSQLSILVHKLTSLTLHVFVQTMSVLSVMRNLRAELDSGGVKPYCFIETNGLKLASPENIYRVSYWEVLRLTTYSCDLIFMLKFSSGYIWSTKWTQSQLEKGFARPERAFFRRETNWERRKQTLHSPDWRTWSSCDTKPISNLCLLSLRCFYFIFCNSS